MPKSTSKLNKEVEELIRKIENREGNTKELIETAEILMKELGSRKNIKEVENAEKNMEKLKNKINNLKDEIIEDFETIKTETVKTENGEIAGKDEEMNRLNKNIERWKRELTEVWAGKETDAAEVERRNLRNLISNAEKRIAELEGKTEEKPEKSAEEVMSSLKEEQEMSNKEEVNKNKIKLKIERYKEEREDYKNNKELYDEYTKKIEEMEKKLDESSMPEKTQEQKDEEIRILTQGKKESEAKIKEIQYQIKLKERKIEDIRFGTEEALEKVELENGEKIQKPKILELYKNIEELEKQIREQENKIKEYQDAINKIKGIVQKEEVKELTSEEIRYFHGQGDMNEIYGTNGEDLRNNRHANDEYFNNAHFTMKNKEDNKAEESFKKPKVEKQQKKVEDSSDEKYEDKELEEYFENYDQEDQEEIAELYSGENRRIISIRINEISGDIDIEKEFSEVDGSIIETCKVEDAFKNKKENYKELEISKRCRKITGDLLEGMLLKRKLNPELIEALKDDDEALDNYIQSTYEEKEYPFDLTHQVQNSKLSFWEKIKINSYAKFEKISGANILGNVWNRRYLLSEGKDTGKKEEKRNFKEEYKVKKPAVIDLEKDFKEQLVKDVKEIMDDNSGREPGDE